jgi:hypothetical protein
VGKVTVEQIEDVESLAREVRVSMDLAPEDFDTAVGIAGRQENIFTIRLTDWQRWVQDEEARRDLAGALALLSVELLPVLDVTPPEGDREPPAPRTQWTEGTMYRILTQASEQKRAREHVMTFMGKGGVGNDWLLFSARPFAGTQMIDPSAIVSVERLGISNGDSEQHFTNKVAG